MNSVQIKYGVPDNSGILSIRLDSDTLHNCLRCLECRIAFAHLASPQIGPGLRQSGVGVREEGTTSMINNTYGEFMFSAVRIVPVIAVVALVAFVCRNRLMFFLGFAGCFTGLLIDRGGSTGGYLDHVTTRADSFLFVGIIGAAIGCLSGYIVALKLARNQDLKPDRSTLPNETGPFE